MTTRLRPTPRRRRPRGPRRHTDGGDRLAVLVSPGRVAKGDGTPYKVFTPYYNAWRNTAGARRPGRVRRRRTGSTRPKRPGGVDIPDAGAELELPAGEKAARRSVDHVR